MKILVLAHAHPDFSVGGAEIAAYNLYNYFRDSSGITATSFLARSGLRSSPPGSITLRRPGEYLWRQDIGDWFMYRTAYPKSMSTSFREFILEKSPDIVFVHHYSHIGVEMLEEIRYSLPNCSLILTLHEYGAICNRQGQMLKNHTDRLCNNESLEDCHLCFTEKSVEDFWLRKRYIQKHFALVDHFVSPSEFLKQRYVDWGIDSSKISVIENGQPTRGSRNSNYSPSRSLRIAYFGQVNKYKGLNIFLRAASLVPESFKGKVQFEVHGANLADQELGLREEIAALCAPLIERGLLQWVGPYERSELMRRMSRADWVVVPSVWWENSPMVIQEAFVCGKPVLCSGIGGMAEKVKDGINGLHFEVGNPLDLAEKFLMILEHGELTARISSNIVQPMSYADSAKEYLRVALSLR